MKKAALCGRLLRLHEQVLERALLREIPAGPGAGAVVGDTNFLVAKADFFGRNFAPVVASNWKLEMITSCRVTVKVSSFWTSC